MFCSFLQLEGSLVGKGSRIAISLHCNTFFSSKVFIISSVTESLILHHETYKQSNVRHAINLQTVECKTNAVSKTNAVRQTLIW